MTGERDRAPTAGARTGHAPVLVYQMGRVGSRSVFEALAVHRDRPETLYHFHHLHHLDRIAVDLEQSPTATDRHRDYLRRAQSVRQQFLADHRRWKVITIARDPVARNLSAFFFRLRDDLPDVYADVARGAVTMTRLTAIFLDHFPHREALNWFDDQFRGLLGVDVFDTPYPTEIGYQIRECADISLLVLRCEDLTRSASVALGQFLGIDGVRLVPNNRGVERPLGPLYREFIARVRLPASYLDSMYESRLARHFYADTGAATLRRLWSRAGRSP